VTQFAADSILPPAPDLEVLHDREYRVQAYRKADDVIMIAGAVRDQKPPGLYLGTDAAPLTIHHMQIELDVSFPSMVITAAKVRFLSFPNDICPDIVEHYDNLVGLSIARGFTHKVRELFGGPRACTHTTALLQAMAPVAIQCVWSMRASQARRESAAAVEAGVETHTPVPASPEQRKAMWQMNINSCHVWAEDSEYVAELEQGAPMPAPVFIRGRMAELGIDESEWTARMWA
jgi:hypothetical protein